MNGCGWNGKKNMKKRKIIDLPKPTMDMLARCAAVLKPPPELTLSEWADKYRVLSAESSAEPGRWHTDKAPYQREIMDAIGDPHIRKVVIMSAAQIGKTDAFILNPLGYYMDYAPAPILVMQPTLDMGQTFSKDRLAPMIRDTPELRDKVDVKSRYSRNRGRPFEPGTEAADDLLGQETRDRQHAGYQRAEPHRNRVRAKHERGMECAVPGLRALPAVRVGQCDL